ncbi:unnamed protein product [Trichobilharzia regenti]|nr:unnamed protein product [Trichobilharzia regenti]
MQNRKLFALCTFALTIVFLYTLMLFWSSYPLDMCSQLISVNRLSEKSYSSNHQKGGNIFMDSPSTLPFLINELMRINHSVHDELISLHQRRKELVDANSVLQNQVERLRSVLVEQSRQIMRLKVSIICMYIIFVYV